MTTVSQLLLEKGHAIWSVIPDATIFEALELMAEKNIGAVLVVAGEQVEGIFSERDYARKVILKGKSSRNTAVKEVMTSTLVFVHSGQSIEECMSLMTEKRIRHLPVLSDDEKLVGVISIGDVVKAFITEQETLIGHLEDYITGKK